MKFYHKIIPILVTIFFTVSCDEEIEFEKPEVKFTIGFSQGLKPTEDFPWSKRMNFEMQLKVSFLPEVKLLIKNADENIQKQINDIEELVEQDIDILIISPLANHQLIPIVEKVYDSGIPIIFIERKISTEKYTAFIGADNYEIGFKAGEYAKMLLNDRGIVLEIRGKEDSPPAQERHKGFMESMNNSNLQVFFGGSGRWSVESSEMLTEKVLRDGVKIDLVFAHSDKMAYGAYRGAKRMGLDNKIIFIGVDALPGEQEGLEMVLNKILDLSILNPTGGEEAINLAMKILSNEMYSRNNYINPVLVDSSNAHILKMQNDRINEDQKKIKAQQIILKDQVMIYKNQKKLFYVTIVILIVFIIIVILLFRAFLQRKKMNQKLEIKSEKIEKQKNAIAEQHKLLKELYKKSENIHKLKVQFFTNISHEFRTPLTLIFGMVELLQQKIHKNDLTGTKELIHLLNKNTKRLLNLINQLLDFRKLDENKMRLNAREQDIVPFLQNITSQFEVMALSRNIDYKTKIEVSKLDVWFEEEKLDKILFNLITNAFKYTPDNGEIRIILKITDAQLNGKSKYVPHVKISVKDSGIGISTQDIQHIFEPFYEVNKNSELNNISSGIGLSLCKSLVNLHHGKMEVNSEIGNGSNFSILLPLGGHHLNENEKYVQSDTKNSFYELTKFLEIHEQQKDQIEETFDIVNNYLDVDKKIILIIEDNADTRQFLQTILSPEYKVIEAEDGLDGLEKAKEIIPDLIISDIMMPKLDGNKLCSEIRNDILLSHIPILILTAKTSDESKIKSYKMGADAFLMKPFSGQMLLIRIENLLKIRQNIIKLFQSGTNNFLQNKGLNNIDKKFIVKLIEQIEQNLGDSYFSVDKLSNNLGFSRIHVYRKVKALTGRTPVEFIRTIRLHKGRELLQQSDLNISEVAYRVGFESPAYFTKTFHELFKMTPTDFVNGYK